MIKKVLLFLLCSVSLQAQHIITGTIESEQNLKWILLYQMQGAQQEYIANTSVVDKKFTLNFPENAPKGVYRLIYTMDSTPFLDIVYNDEDIELSFDPLQPNETVKFTKSEENKLLHEYLVATGGPQYKLDSAQIAYFSADAAKRAVLKNIYKTNYEKFKKAQQTYEQLSNGKLVHHFIKASQRYNAEEPVEVPEVYLHNLKTHYFDYLDVDDEVLINSTMINDKINDFIFYVNRSDDANMNAKLQKVAVATAIGKVEHNPKLAKDIEEGLIYTFVNQQNADMVQYIINNHYEKLPFNYQDTAFIKDIEGQLRTSIGKKAPNFKWSDNRTAKDLYSLSGKNYYVIAFWSSTCGHCLKEMPLLYDFLKDKNSTQAIAIGLEDKTSESGWKTQIQQYLTFVNVLGENKWNNPIAKEYGINATPTFFILDADKNVLAKPDDVEALKSFFKTLKQ